MRTAFPYQLYTHPAVFTIEEMEAQDFEGKSNIAKNLFLRNANGKQHFLIVMKGQACQFKGPAAAAGDNAPELCLAGTAGKSICIWKRAQ